MVEDGFGSYEKLASRADLQLRLFDNSSTHVVENQLRRRRPTSRRGSAFFGRGLQVRRPGGISMTTLGLLAGRRGGGGWERPRRGGAARERGAAKS